MNLTPPETATSAPAGLAARAGLFVLRGLRYFYGLFYLLGGLYKIPRGYLWSDVLRQMFEQRLTEIDAGSFAATYLQTFGIPMYLPIAWVVTLGEVLVGAGLLLGLAMRLNLWLALFITVNIGIGGYYDASLVPFIVIPVLLLLFPSAWTPGVDILRRRYPGSHWLR